MKVLKTVITILYGVQYGYFCGLSSGFSLFSFFIKQISRSPGYSSFDFNSNFKNIASSRYESPKTNKTYLFRSEKIQMICFHFCTLLHDPCVENVYKPENDQRENKVPQSVLSPQKIHDEE